MQLRLWYYYYYYCVLVMRHYAILSLQILFTFARSLRESLSVGAIFICFALDTRYDESETRWPTYAPYEEAMKQQWK